MALFGKTTKKEEKEKKDTKKDTSKKESMKDLYGGKDEKKKNVEEKKIDSKVTDTKKKNTLANSTSSLQASSGQGQAYKILVKPLITEKATIMGQENKYVFEVKRDSNKVEIIKAIEEVYKVRPVSVNTVNMMGKKVRTGRYMGKRKDWKKAIVTLPKGKTINIYEGV